MNIPSRKILVQVPVCLIMAGRYTLNGLCLHALFLLFIIKCFIIVYVHTGDKKIS
jgi:hypothetical protein